MSTRDVITLACASCAAIALAACDTSRAQVILAQEQAPTTNPEFAAARAAAANDFWRTCCARLWRVNLDAGVEDPFAAHYDSLQKSVKQHLEYDPALGTACIAGLRVAAAACALTQAAADAIDRACFGYRGTLSAGDDCSDDVECAAPAGGRALCLRGSPVATASVGTCAVLGRGVKGDLCDPFVEAGVLHFCDSAEGLYCGQSGACESRAADGGACIRSSRYADACATGLTCGTGSTCGPTKAPDAGCAANAECGSGICYQHACAETEPAPSFDRCGGQAVAPAADAGIADGAADAEGG